MKTIREILNSKPSAALQAMVDGLRNQTKRPDFQLDMDTFGAVKDGICFGCAATCTVQEIAGINLTIAGRGVGDGDYDFRSQAHVMGFGVDDLIEFEVAMDMARRGMFAALFEYMGLPRHISFDFSDNGYSKISEWNWEKKLPEVEKTIQEMQAAGY